MTLERRFFYGWVIVALAFLAITTYGLFYSYSVFLGPLEKEFGVSRTAISAVYTIYMMVYSFCAIPMGRFSDKFGPQKTIWLAALLIGAGIMLCSTATSVWQLYIYFGVIASVGHGAVFVVPVSTLNRWFIHRRGLAVGLATSGLGLSLLVLPRFATQLIASYGWRTSFVILGGMFLVINAAVGSLIKGKPEEKGLKPLGWSGGVSPSAVSIHRDRDFHVLEALKTRAFWYLFLISVFCFAAEQMVLVHSIAYGGVLGLTPAQASLGLSALGIGTIAGRASTGALSDKIGRISMLVLGCAIEAITIFYLIAIKSSLALYLTMFFLGFGYGSWVVLCSVALADFFGLKNAGVLLGIWFLGGAPAGFLGPLLAGAVYDATGAYFKAFLIAGILCVIATGLAAVTRSPGHPGRLKEPPTVKGR